MTSRTTEELKGVSLLGKKGVEYLGKYSTQILESFEY